MTELVTIILKGTSHYQDAIAKLPTDASGVLVPEPENQFDSNACAVLSSGSKVGYLPKGWTGYSWGSQVIRQLKDGEGVVRLIRVGGHQLDNGTQAYFGLRLVLTFPQTTYTTPYYAPIRQ